MKTIVQRFLGEEQGQDLIEYGLLLGIVTLAALIAIEAIGPKVSAYFSNLNANLP